MYLGIDLGTSNSAVVGYDGSELRLFKTVDGSDVLPSAIMIDRRGAIFVGKRAYEQDAFSPESVAKRFKRLLGTTTPLNFDGAKRTMNPEEASAEVLKTLLAQVKLAAPDFEIEGTVITIPAAFNQMQCEATMRSASAAGINQVGLLQEPIAAALASIASRTKKNPALKDGQFLVYDLGGGTFDAALVQSVGGTVNVVAHAGINMLGGSDFDRTIVNTIVRPWLLQTFDLPSDLQKEANYQRVLRIGAFCAEKAKIDVSSQTASVILADEKQIATRDKAGKDIYLDIPLSRGQVEELVVDQVDRTIDECRKLLRENGYDSGDIDRIVLIGGPTRMPIVRKRVSEQLGISIDLDLDPLTAVAAGAAIFAESREWKGTTSKAKSSRGTTLSEGKVKIEYGYPERTSDARIRVRVRAPNDALSKGYRLQLDSDAGWTTGQLPLDGTNAINDVPLARRGDNQFRATVFDSSGAPVPQAEVRFTVRKADAMAGGAPVTHTIAVKVVEGAIGAERNILHVLVEKGTPLPTSGTGPYRAASDLRGGSESDYLEFEVYQMEAAVPDPSVNLRIGAFRINATDLDRGEVVRRGDPIVVHWTLDENGLLDCSLEVSSRRFTTKMFTEQGALKNFEGPEGEQLASSMINTAQTELDDLTKTLGTRVDSEAAELQQRVEQQRQNLAASYESDTRRSIAEESRAIRQEIATIKNKPEFRAHSLQAEVRGLIDAYDSGVRQMASAQASERFDRLARQALDAIAQGRLEDSKKSVIEMRAIAFDELRKQPSFIVNMFLEVARDRHLAIDKALHDRLVDEGKTKIDQQDVDGLRMVIGRLLDNRPTDMQAGGATALAGLMK